MKEQAMKKLVALDEALARSDSTLVLETAKASALASMSLFLRHYRGRNDFAKSVGAISGRETQFASAIEELRSAIYSGEVPRAEALLAKASPESPLESVELELERLRLLVHLKSQWQEGLALSEKLLRDPALPEISRMTCLQIRGCALIRLGRTAEAVRELQKGTAMAEIFGLASSAFSAFGFLVQAHSELENRKDAEDTLSALHGLLDSLDSDELWIDRLLTVIRSEYHFHKAFSSERKQMQALMEAHEIASWLGDQDTSQRCVRELASNAHGPLLPEDQVVFTHRGWVFLPGRDLLLARYPKSLRRLEKHPLAKKILLCLSRGRKTQEELFSEVWGLRFDPERHGTFLRAAISKLRKLLPKDGLRVSEGIVYLA